MCTTTTFPSCFGPLQELHLDFFITTSTLEDFFNVVDDGCKGQNVGNAVRYRACRYGRDHTRGFRMAVEHKGARVSAASKPAIASSWSNDKSLPLHQGTLAAINIGRGIMDRDASVNIMKSSNCVACRTANLETDRSPVEKQLLLLLLRTLRGVSSPSLFIPPYQDWTQTSRSWKARDSA